MIKNILIAWFFIVVGIAIGIGIDTKMDAPKVVLGEPTIVVDTLTEPKLEEVIQSAVMQADIESQVSKAGNDTIEIVQYTVQEGDTLSDIANQYYGDPSFFQMLADGNDISNPNLILVGQVLNIPLI